MTKKDIKALAYKISGKFRKTLPGAKLINKHFSLKDGVISFF